MKTLTVTKCLTRDVTYDVYLNNNSLGYMVSINAKDRITSIYDVVNETFVNPDTEVYVTIADYFLKTE